MIRVEDLAFTYGEGQFRLDVPELDVERGSRAACIGASGTGKSTLACLIAGILLPERGRVILAGREVSGLGDTERRALRIREIGFVFQQFELLDYLTSYDNILLPFHVSPAVTLDAGVHERARELAAAMGVEHVVQRRPDRLSQGERQRIAICRALVTEPRLVICDEPTGNLDPVTAGTILDLLFEQVESRGATLLMVTHDHDLLDRFDRIVDMRDLNRRSTA